MKNVILIIGIVSLLILTGCENVPPDSKAQDMLLSELKHCDAKFGTDSSEKRERNEKYCNKVLALVEQLIYDGYFGDVEINKPEIQNLNTEDLDEKEKQAYRDLEETSNTIMGEI